jgi:hypothetical protein
MTNPVVLFFEGEDISWELVGKNNILRQYFPSMLLVPFSRWVNSTAMKCAVNMNSA